MNKPKILKIVVSNTGQKIKTYRLTLNQNSNYNTLVLLSENKCDNVTCVFKSPSGKLSPKYHMIYKGLDKLDDTGDELYDGYHRYEFTIPYSITNVIMPNPSMRMDVSFTLYKLNKYNQQIYPTVANSQITINRSNQNDQLDESYNLTDVENLWYAVGEYYNNNIQLKNQVLTLESRVDDLESRLSILENNNN